ncbi:hypothetical protein [Streptomyces qinglanensis]|uniref:Uncharacterized protein n=1 Tax=Streptomyces qinglanensis TaxID=943816 RepID=A0A1H9SU66_9ACTN|nr:hypothetical protein [Streptomyces qinglanensis]SER88428.1 hypothetical protein SAMN05421870_10598 [Streptomyces qinglanensis]
MTGRDAPSGLLEVVSGGLGRYWDGTAVTAPAAWTEAPLADRTAALTELAWQARGAESAHPATHAASRLALAAAQEAWAWGVALAAGADIPPFRLLPRWLAHDPPDVQLEACVRLLAAARTGVLPAAPYRCAVCPADQNLHLVVHVRCTGPGLQEWRCGLCAGLPLDPDTVPEPLDVLYRRQPGRDDDRP